MKTTPLPDPRGTTIRAFTKPSPDLYDALLELAEEHELATQVYWARELASWPRALSQPERDGLLLLALAVRLATAAGSTRLPLAEAQSWLEQQLAARGDDGEPVHPNWVAPWSELAGALRQDIPASLGEVLGRPGDYKPLIVDGAHVYAQRMWHHERRLVEALAARRRTGGDDDRFDASLIDQTLREVLARPPLAQGRPVRLSDEQEQAVRAALSGRLTLVTGGPGTGKTSIVVSMLRALARLGVPMERVALAAPTGKAANRMAEAIAQGLATLDDTDVHPDDRALRAAPPEARTLHRLLGYSPTQRRFRQHEANPLAEEVVIVDEGSMIDLRMMDALVRAVRPEARLVLLGDAAQLPSVEAGAVFRDLFASAAMRAHAVRLTKSYRMRDDDPEGKAVLSAANAVKEGVATGWGEAASTATLRFSKVERLARSEREGFLARWFHERVLGLPDLAQRVRHELTLDDRGAFSDEEAAALRELLAHFESSRLLCVTRRQPQTGAEDVNAWMHERLRDALYPPMGRPPTGRQHGWRFLPGEPVMVQHNDYARELWNGDQGVVLWVRDAGSTRARPRVVFRRGTRFVAHPLAEIRGALDHAFAITVHKAQGSECERVALLLPDEDLPLLSRELLYTAMTRARRSVVLVGDEERLTFAVDNVVERWSGVAERLALVGQAG